MKPQMFLKLSEEISKDFQSLMATSIMQKTLESLKDAADTGTFKFVISTDDEDRQGEKVNQAGLDFTHYMKNPVVLWGHNYGEPPIGVTTRVWKDGNKTMAEGKWAPSAFAQELRKLYDAGFLRACSIGYIPKELDEDGNTQKGEVLEYSIVSIPANPFALTADSMKQYKFDLNMLASKGIDFKVDGEVKTTTPVVTKADAVAGDACQMDDGTPGTMADDGNGGLVCNPVENASAEKPKAAKPDSENPDPDGDGDNDQGDQPNSEDAEDNLHEMLGGEHIKHKSYTMDAIEEFKTFAKGNSEDGDGKKAAHGKMVDKVDGEHDRHDKAVIKGIEEFTKSIEEFHSGTKAAKPKPEDGDGVPAPVAKALEVFKKAMIDEHDDHREKCNKTVEEYGKKCVKEESADKIDNLHEKCTKSINQAHEAHIKAIDGHIEKCTKAIEEFGDGEKTVDAGKNKGEVADELAVSQEKQQKFQKVNKVWDIFDAFICAYLDDGTPVADFEKLLDEALPLLAGRSLITAVKSSMAITLALSAIVFAAV